jgi:hypothetical protein
MGPKVAPPGITRRYTSYIEQRFQVFLGVADNVASIDGMKYCCHIDLLNLS